MSMENNLSKMRLIDANALEDDCNIFNAWDAQIVKECLKDQPTIEAQPIRHGQWILCEDQYNVDNDNGNYAYFCSQCHCQDVHS